MFVSNIVVVLCSEDQNTDHQTFRTTSLQSDDIISRKILLYSRVVAKVTVTLTFPPHV